MLAHQQPHVVAPQQLEAHPARALVLALAEALRALPDVAAAVLEVQQVGVDLARRDTPQRQPSGQLGAELRA